MTMVTICLDMTMSMAAMIPVLTAQAKEVQAIEAAVETVKVTVTPAHTHLNQELVTPIRTLAPIAVVGVAEDREEAPARIPRYQVHYDLIVTIIGLTLITQMTIMEAGLAVEAAVTVIVAAAAAVVVAVVVVEVIVVVEAEIALIAMVV